MNKIDSETTIAETELAGLIGVSSRRVRQMVESGDLERVSPGRVLLGASIKTLIDLAAGSGSELQRERTRAVRAQADMRELEFAKAKGEVALISDFERVTAASYAAIRTNVMSVAQRACLRLLSESNETTFKRVLREELTLALRTAAEAPLQLDAEDMEASA